MATRKEISQLWWEYLKRSDKYRGFCGWARKNRKKGIIGDYSIQQVPKRFLEPQGRKLPFVDGYSLWGDVFVNNFEEWWDEMGKAMAKVREWRGGYVENFSKKAEKYIKTKMREFREEDPNEDLKEENLRVYRETLYDLIRSFSSEIDVLYLRVPLRAEESVSNLLKQCRPIIRDALLRSKGLRPWRISDPSYRIRFGPLQKYLGVYDRVSALKKQGKKWDDIFKNFYPEIEKGLLDESLSQKECDRLEQRRDSRMRQLKRDYANAKKIIKNVEKGDFPGKY